MQTLKINLTKLGQISALRAEAEAGLCYQLCPSKEATLRVLLTDTGYNGKRVQCSYYFKVR